MLAATYHWSDMTTGQRIFAVYFVTGLIFSLALRTYLEPRQRGGLPNAVDWEPKGKRTAGLYRILLLLGVHPITIVLAGLLWPIWILAFLVVRFFG